MTTLLDRIPNPFDAWENLPTRRKKALVRVGIGIATTIGLAALRGRLSSGKSGGGLQASATDKVPQWGDADTPSFYWDLSEIFDLD